MIDDRYRIETLRRGAKWLRLALPPEQLAADILKKEQRIAEIMAEIQAVLRQAA